MPGKEETITLKIARMTCASCAARIEKSLKEINGVTAANVNYAVEKATVVFDTSLVKPEDLKQAIEQSGYKVQERVKSDFKVSGMTCAFCASKIEKTLNTVNGVYSAGVNFAMERVSVEYDSTITSPAKLISVNKYTDAELLTLAASVEKSSEHPLGQAIVKYTIEKGLQLNDTADFNAIPGHGIEAIIGELRLVIGNAVGVGFGWWYAIQKRKVK